MVTSFCRRLISRTTSHNTGSLMRRTEIPFIYALSTYSNPTFNIALNSSIHLLKRTTRFFSEMLCFTMHHAKGKTAVPLRLDRGSMGKSSSENGLSSLFITSESGRNTMKIPWIGIRHAQLVCLLLRVAHQNENWRNKSLR